jgi:nucleotide-binding universal stress UspA family protein
VQPADDENNQEQEVRGGPFRRTLVAFDGSADSVVALKTATAMMGTSSGHVVALAVLSSAAHREADRDGPAQDSEQARVESTFENARAAVARSTPARLDLHALQGRQVAASICEYAAEHGFDLLVVGRHSDGSLKSPKLGHVAETVARTCRIPVLIVGTG